MTDAVTLEIRDGASGALAAADEAFATGLRGLAEATAAAMLDDARALASGAILRDVTGAYRDSLYAEVARGQNGFLVRLGSHLDYAGILEFGGTTAPHDIAVDEADALHFFAGDDAEAAFAKVVHDPGARIGAHPVLRTALADSVGAARADAADLVTRMVRAFG